MKRPLISEKYIKGQVNGHVLLKWTGN